jgi:hypothetical protein
MCRNGVDADRNVAKVRVAGSNPVVRSKEVQVSGLSGPLIRVLAGMRGGKSAENPRR